MKTDRILSRLPSRRAAYRLFIAYTIFLTLISTPLFYNQYLRAQYINLLANWAAKARAPTFALIGDSITAGGGAWGWRLAGDPLSAISFGSNGNTLQQIALQGDKALTLHPKYLLIQGGINDVLLDDNDPSRWASGLEGTARNAKRVDARIVLTLPLPTANAKANTSLLVIRDRLLRDFPSAICVDATQALAPAGLLKPEYTIDGVHLTEAGYRIWAAEIRASIEQNRHCQAPKGGALLQP